MGHTSKHETIPTIYMWNLLLMITVLTLTFNLIKESYMSYTSKQLSIAKNQTRELKSSVIFLSLPSNH